MAYKHSYLVNPASVTSHSDAAPPPANMVVSNSTTNSLDLISLSPATQPNQPPLFVRIPLQAAVPLLNSNRPSSIHCFHEIVANQGVVPQLHYNLRMPPPMNNMTNILARPGLQHPSIMPSTQQGWSLSSSSQLTTYIHCPSEPRIPAPVTEISQASTEEVRFAGASEPASLASNGFSGLQSALMSSEYLKVAQQLLDEVVGLGNEMKAESTKETKSAIQVRSSGDTRDSDDGDASMKQGAELTVAERQELQIKKSKLVDMLDEVEQRCRQYCHQLQNVVAAFEAAAGFASSRTYTAPVLKTISKQFQCLRDSISVQVQATSKSLGEEDYLGLGIKSPSSRVRFIDHHRRHKKAIQQLGMIQHNTWRSQKGLPERAVSVLRAWLFEHFLHPYPKDSDKLMLAEQTGLTRSQVSNWFINARVRLWKPMVEKMYLEDIKEHEQNNMNDTTSKRVLTSHSTSKSPPITVSTSAKKDDENHKSFVEDETIKQSRIKKARTEEPLHPNNRPRSVNMGLISRGEGSQGVNGNHGYSLLTNCINNGGSFAPHSIVEFEKFDPEQFTSRFSGNRVSLTLGLQQCEALPLSEAQQPYLPSESIPFVRRLEH